MRKIFMTLGFVAFLFTANAQVKGTQSRRESLKILMGMKEGKELNSSLKRLEKSKNEDDRLLAYSYYSQKENQEKAAELKDLMIESFPNGRLATEKKARDIMQLSALEERDAQFQQLLKDNPDASVGFDMYYMAMAYADRGNEAKMREYVGYYRKSARDVKGNELDERKVLAGLAPNLARLNPEAALPLLAGGLEFQREDLSIPEEGETEEIRAQRRSRSEQSYYSMIASYAEALLKTDKKAEGLELISIMKHELKGKRVGQIFSYIYADALLANEKYAEALPYLEERYTKSMTGKDIDDLLQKGYVAKNGSLNGFKEYKASLEDTRSVYNKEQLMKKLISKPAPDFELKDVDGNTVRLADLKGKVVVLDFWATWCGPCKASFPMMQKAVNKYKNDPNVKFLFIHTWEKGSGDPAVNAKKYVTDNNYTFEVLMDLRDKDTKVSAVAKAYQVDGIPAKFVIDVNGQIRFDSGGAAIDEEKAVEDLSAMIEFAKKG